MVNITANITGVEAGTGGRLFQHWWQWVLVGFILTSITLGSGYIALALWKRARRHFAPKNKLPAETLSRIVNHVQKYAGSRSQLTLEKSEKTSPTSLAVYLGHFGAPPTTAQTQLLSSRDTIILNPLQPNVNNALANLRHNANKPNSIIGRLDLEGIMNVSLNPRKPEEFLISGVDAVMTIVLSRFQDSSGQNVFTGVLLAGWEIIPASILIELSDVLSTLNLEVYLETSGPDFLKDSSVLRSESVTGLVMRGGLILKNGERRDCFDMEPLRATVKAFVSQSCYRDFNVLVWETLEDDAVLPHEVLRRTFTWCNFYNAVPWIGRQGALFDAFVDIAPTEPLSAFDWLKQPRVMELHELWKGKRAASHLSGGHSVIEQLGAIIPSLDTITKATPCQHAPANTNLALAVDSSEVPDWFILKDTTIGDPLSSSPAGNSHDGLGCFPLGADVSMDDYQEIVFSQRNLRKLELLDVVDPDELRRYGVIFSNFIADVDVWTESSRLGSPCSQEVVEDLARTLNQTPYDGSEGVRVHLGLHSGFQRTTKKHFWAVYHVHPSSTTDIYISKNVQDVLGTILHTYLSAQGLNRRQCLAAEISFARWQEKPIQSHSLPPRVLQDVELLSPEECIQLLQRVSLADEAEKDPILCGVKSLVLERLIDAPTLNQLKTINTVGYLDGTATVDHLVQSRLQWHCQCRRPHPDPETAISLFHEIETRILNALKGRNHDDLQTLADALDIILRHHAVDAVGDIIALAVFCTMRKLAIEEVYIEVTDRNPLFNDQTDQAAAFAELFALGSRCEAYFDVTPSQFGQLLSKKFRDYYGTDQHQPPPYEETQVALSSAYSEAQIDVDPNHKTTEMPAYQRFTFMSVFAIPALIDILMLTTTGHGLYLASSRYMTQEEVHSATTALMISLLLSGAIGTWITCGGTYYLASMAFSAMNYFVVTRLLGGFAFTLAVGTVGFICFVCLSGGHAAVVFLFYLIALTSYLCLLAALANYQFIGSAFQSGRAVILTCLPLLFISPITTMFVNGHAVIIYLTVLFVFVTLLLLGVRRTGSRWTTFYQKIDLIEDSELRNWYINRRNDRCQEDLENMSDPAILRLARQALLHEVLIEQKKFFFSSKTQDPLVSKMVKSFEATVFLMDWYCQFSGVRKPVLFSSAWNVQTKVALNSLQKSQLGIRFHNAFIHWRQAGDEIGCTMLYFVIALLDKWIALINGGQLAGLTSGNVDLIKPVGFGLAYYLIGAVLLDFNAHKLHQLAAKNEEEILSSDESIAHAVKTKAQKRRLLYWRTLWRYLMFHVWGLALTSTLLWLFTSEVTKKDATLVFVSYVAAYTGLLWYQFTKIFAGPRALKPLLIGAAIGLPIGFILDHQFPHFVFADIIALGVATWTVAILSLWAGKILGPPEDIPRPRNGAGSTYHAYSGPGPDQAWSQPELRGLHDQLTDLPENKKLHVDPKSAFGHEVKQILTQCGYTKLSSLAERAFPEAEALLSLARRLFNEKLITVELVALGHFSKYGKAIRAVSSIHDATVRLVVGCEIKGVTENEDPLPGFQQDVAELLLQVAAERYLGYSSRDAVLAQTLWSENRSWTNDSVAPSTLERQLRFLAKSGNPHDLIDHLKKELLRDLCLGFDCEIDWDNLPADIRYYLVNRCLGIHSPLSEEQISFFNEKITCIPGQGLESYLARCDYAAFSGAISISRVSSWVSGDQSRRSHRALKPQPSTRSLHQIVHLLENTYSPPKYSFYDKVLKYSGMVYHHIGTLCKFFSVAFVADPEYQREVRCTFPDSSHVGNSITRGILLLTWSWSKAIQRFLLPTFMFYRRNHVANVWNNIQGMEVSFKRHRILIRNLDGAHTGFVHPVDTDTFRLLQYRGDHKTEPSDNKELLVAINMYSKKMTLLRRVELNNGNTVNDYEYEYRIPDHVAPRRISKSDIFNSPITRKGVAGQNNLQAVNYNVRGQIDSGSYVKDGNLVRFQYHYKKEAKHNGALLRAEFVLPHMSCTVSWCAAPRRRPERLESWIPHSQVTEATFVIGPDVWESKYIYDHKFHPTIVTTLNGQRVDTPNLILYDHLDVLKKPKHVSFLDDNPLFSFTSIRSNPITRWLGVNTRRYSVSTSQARSWLWKAWREDPTFDGVIVRWLDERLLRRDPVLAPYWRKRDSGHLAAAELFLDNNRDAVIASVDLDNTISSWTPLAIKINDLYSFGQGGDACSRTRSNLTTQSEDTNALHVIAVDTGTWPNEGGGVSACRSDVINNLRTIKWHMVAESANDFGIPKRQIERNVHSLKIIPLWGLDLMTPTHGLFANRLDSEVDHLTTHITLLDIEQTFVPILAALISGARSMDFSMSDVKQVTRALINLNDYFSQHARHWSLVWRSDVVKAAWRKLWLSQTASNSRPSSEWLRAEWPTLGQLDQGLELWSRYLFIFSIPIPEKMPAVFQASHHSVSASYGIVCKLKRGCTLQIWDHAISWRETNLYLSSALCPLSPFTRNALLGLMKMTSVLTLHHADTILPCADFFNPNWEVEIGTCQGRIEHRSAFRRKIDPVVNGITNMERFAPVKEIKSKTPTVTMLSHVWYAKDIKTALLAADIIINKWGFKDYKLEIYGALDKTPAYTTSCQEIIATKNLRKHVNLMGEADPIMVLERTWVFLNSSISEGLPLALGEAALTGAPVVCTDVGASLRVLTNPEDGSCYSEVVAPNDALAMARAQIKLLALLEEWSDHADENLHTLETADASFPETPTPEDVTRITRRMNEQTEARRKLGMRARKIVQKSFSGDRYLREHEQMLWIGKARKDMTKPSASRAAMRLPLPQPVRFAETVTEPVRPARPSLLSKTIQRSSVQPSSVQDDSLPSLAFGGASTMPSIMTSMGTLDTSLVPSVIGSLAVAEQDWIKRPQQTVVKVIDVRHLRREGRTVSGTSGLTGLSVLANDESMVNMV